MLSVTYINLTHNFVTYHLSHCHIHTLNTQLCHIPSVTYMTSHTHLRHIPSSTLSLTYMTSHTTFVTYHLTHCHTYNNFTHTHKLNTQYFVTYHLSHISALCVAGVAQGDIHLRFAWQAWHTLTSTFVLRGRRGTYDTLRGRRGTRWHRRAFVSRGWRGTLSHPLSFFVAGVALMALGGALGLVLGARDAAALCVAAGVALGDIDVRFTWQAWHNLTISHIHLRFARQAWHKVTSTCVSRGRRGTISHPPSFRVAGVALMALGGALGLVLGARDAAALCVAGVALGDIDARFTWQVWHNLTSTFVLRGRRGTHGTGWRAWAGFRRPWRRGTLRGRCGTWWHLRAFHVAAVAQSHIHLRFAWQAWHIWRRAWAGFRRPWRRGTLRGRRGTWWHRRAFHVAGVAQISHPPSFRVAGVALMALGGALGLVLGARDAAALCVAGVALSDIDVRFTWQVWHNLTSTFVLRGRPGTHGTGWRAWAGFRRPWRRGTLCGRRGTWWHQRAFHVAGVAQSHNISHPPSFCAAGVAQGDIDVRFTWQAWHNLTHTSLSHTFCHIPSLSHTICLKVLLHTIFHTIFVNNSLTHIFVTHHPPASRFTLIILFHTHFVTYNLSRTTLSHTVCHILSFTSRFGSSKFMFRLPCLPVCLPSCVSGLFWHVCFSSLFSSSKSDWSRKPFGHQISHISFTGMFT